jgi:hypothetical protein
MIGYDLGVMGGDDRMVNPDAVRETWDRVTDVFTTRVPELLEPVWELVGRVVETSRWVLETVAQVYPVTWERWETGADERVCPECGPLHGQAWPDGEGDVPPVHVNCRCQRVYAFTEWRTRWIAEWRLRWSWQTVFDWRITGWE